MHTLSVFFEELLRNIQPPEDRLKAAQEVPNEVRDFLRALEDYKTTDPHSRLIGSYSRHTAIGDIKDVDIVVFVDHDEVDSPRTVIRELKRALDAFPNYLGSFGSVEVLTQRRSVHVYIEDRDFHLDVVPALIKNGIEYPLLVPDKLQETWIESHPIGFIEYLTDLNADHGEKPRPLVKLLKFFRDCQMVNRRPKSYLLEALVVNLVEKGQLDTDNSLSMVFRDLLDAIYLRFTPALEKGGGAVPFVPDPMLNHNLSKTWERSHFETFMRRVDEGRRLADRALAAGDISEAVELWQRVFDDEYFPSDVQDSLKLAQRLTPGLAFVTGAGKVRADKDERSTPSIPTKYYGW
ncbi:MAG: nucleotidyltransferase [Dehalococcoidia bacterium]